MNRTFNITLKAAAAILAVILAASCVFEKENPVSKQQKQNVLVQIGVSTDGMAQTKADVINGTDQPGEGVDTTISTLRLYAYIGNVLSGYAYVPEYSATDKIYMDLKNLPSSGTQQVEFVAVANEGSMTGINGINIEVGTNSDGTISLPSNFGRNSFEGIIYTIANQGFTAKVDEKEKVVGMPMYATKTVTIDVDKVVGDPNTADGHNGHFILQESVNLTLTRSLAKIEVYAAEDAGEGSSTEVIASDAGIKITGVEIVNPVAEGKLFPLADTESTQDPGTAVLMELDLPENATENTVSVDKAVKDGNYTISGRYTPVTTAYYLAENDNGESSEFSYGEFTNKDDLDTKAAGATALKITYKVGNSEKTGYVIMPPIERNTWYKVLARITAGGQMNLTFVAQPWNVYTESISYSDQITVSEGGRIRWINHQPDLNAEIVTYGEDIKCEFKIDTPSGAMWHASFIPVSGDANAFGFEKNGVISSVAEGKVGENANLTIRPLGKDLIQNNVAILRIVVKTTDGRTIAVVKNDVLSGNSSYNNKEYTITHSK